MDERQEGQGELVVARGDASELFDTGEETLDQVAVAVEMMVEGTGLESIGARRDHGLAALCRDCLNEGIGIVALVGNDKVGGCVLDQCLRLFDVGDLPCR